MIVDGRAVPVTPGASVLTAAAAAGIATPTLCHHPALPPDGSCRICLSFHFAEAAANELTHAALDPVARIPEYKVCAVALEVADRS